MYLNRGLRNQEIKSTVHCLQEITVAVLQSPAGPQLTVHFCCYALDLCCHEKCLILETGWAKWFTEAKLKNYRALWQTLLFLTFNLFVLFHSDLLTAYVHLTFSIGIKISCRPSHRWMESSLVYLLCGILANTDTPRKTYWKSCDFSHQQPGIIKQN